MEELLAASKLGILSFADFFPLFFHLLNYEISSGEGGDTFRLLCCFSCAESTHRMLKSCHPLV